MGITIDLSLTSALAVSIGVAIQNVLEGAIISLPCSTVKMSGSSRPEPFCSGEEKEIRKKPYEIVA